MENNNLIPMGKRIGEIRRANHITQEKLADILDVSPKHISHTERGTSSLSLNNLIEFCNICDCSLDYIVLGKSSDKIISRMPTEIFEILDHGTDDQIKRLNKFLEMYIELSHNNE